MLIRSNEEAKKCCVGACLSVKRELIEISATAMAATVPRRFGFSDQGDQFTNQNMSGVVPTARCPRSGSTQRVGGMRKRAYTQDKLRWPAATVTGLGDAVQHGNGEPWRFCPADTCKNARARASAIAARHRRARIREYGFARPGWQESGI